MKNKPLLVCIPGTLCTSEMFLPIIDKLEYDTLSIDYALHNSLQSMSNEVLDQVAGRPFIPVGFSMGGMVAFELIRRARQQVQGLILLGSNAHADLPGRKQGRETHLALAKKNGIKTLTQEVYLPVYFADTSGPKSELVVKMAECLGVDVFEAQLKVLAERPDSLDILASYAGPSLILGGENDLPCPPEHQKVMADTAMNSELHILPQCGHFAALEQAQNIAQLIKQWVNKHYA
jgi:pimeloyl-ACP methyl ester carboxylesterase